MNAVNSHHGISQLIVCLSLLSIVEGVIINVYTGGTVSLDCSNVSSSVVNASSVNTTVTEWRKHDILFKEITYRPEPAGGWSSEILHLENLLLADSGVYRCICTRNGTLVGNKTFSLHVAAEKTTRKPEITTTTMDRNISVFVGEKVILKCHVKSSEAPYIRWYYKQNTISPAKIPKLVMDHTGIAFSSKLVLEKTRLKDGFYTCFVFNQYGVNSKSVYVRVKPVPPKKKSELAEAYERKFITDESVPLGVVIGIPVSVLIIVLAAALTLYERYSWRQTGRNDRGRSISEEDTPMLKPSHVDMNRNNNSGKGKNNLNGEAHHDDPPNRNISSAHTYVDLDDDISTAHPIYMDEGDDDDDDDDVSTARHPYVDEGADDVFTPHPYVDEDGHDVLKEISSSEKSSIHPDIDLEWEGVELKPSLDTLDELKPSMAVPEDDLTFSVHEDLWELCDKYSRKTRPVMVPKNNRKTGSTTETIV